MSRPAARPVITGYTRTTGAVYAIVPGRPAPRTVLPRFVAPAGKRATLLGGGDARWRVEGGATVVEVPAERLGGLSEHAHVFRFA